MNIESAIRIYENKLAMSLMAITLILFLFFWVEKILKILHNFQCNIIVKITNFFVEKIIFLFFDINKEIFLNAKQYQDKFFYA